MFLLLLSILIASTNAAALLNKVRKGKDKQSLLQGNGDQEIEYRACHDPPVSELYRNECDGRMVLGKKKKRKNTPCFKCEVGSYDFQRIVEDTQDLTSDTNVCVERETDCEIPTPVPRNSNLMKASCGGNFGNCGLAPKPRVAKRRIIMYDIDAMGHQEMRNEWIYLETYQVTNGGAKFMHVTTPAAAEQIITDQLIKASGALDDAHAPRFGTGGQHNTIAKRAEDRVSLYPILSNLDEDGLADKAAALQYDSARKWGLHQRQKPENLATILVTLPEGTTLEGDQNYDYSVYHNGNIQAGQTITITRVQAGDRAEVGSSAEIGSSAEVQVQGRRAEVELKQKMQFMGFTVFLVVFVIFIIHNCRKSKSHQINEMYEKLPEEI